jgi:type IV secretory pathway VirB10-like protein
MFSFIFLTSFGQQNEANKTEEKPMLTKEVRVSNNKEKAKKEIAKEPKMAVSSKSSTAPQKIKNEEEPVMKKTERIIEQPIKK